MKTEPLPVFVVAEDSALIRTLAYILLAERTVPALAVIDLRRLDLQGMKLVSRLHALSNRTEVVVLTSSASLASAVAALDEHRVDYLVKPVDVEQLLNVASVATARSQRRHAEERLRESDERFRRVVESDMLGIMFWTLDGGIYDANSAFLRMLGYSRHDVESGELEWTFLTPPEYLESDAATMRELADKGVIPPYEKEYFRKDGSRVHILIGAATLEGRKDRGVAFVLDISDRKRAEHALEVRVRQQAAVAGFGQRALVVENLNGLMREAVALVAETLDLPLSCVLERRSDGATLLLCDGVGWSPEDVGHLTVAINLETQAGYTLSRNEPTIVEDMSLELRFGVGAQRLRDREIASGITVVIPGQVTPFGVLAAHDRRPRRFTQDDVHFLQAIAHVLGTAVERNRGDAASRQSQRLEAVGRLASGVAHDFNNMLTAITSYGELLRDALEAKSALRDDVDEILKAAGRAAALTRQLLAFSRQQVLQPRKVLLNDIVVDVEKMLRRLIGSNITFSTALDPNLAWVEADPGQIEQVILNLCVNARDAMPNGGKLIIETANAELDSVQTQEHSIESPGAYVMLAVSDTGIGMAPETKALIFEPFFTTKPPEQGTGLGLATVYGIVKQSGGEIYVYSEPGQGTAFKIFLPRLHESDIADQVQKPRPETVRGTETVVLAEDEDSIRDAAQRMLERAGYTVLAARNGAEALSIIEKHEGPVHLLITDMVMPQLNGRQLAERARAVRSGLPVLYLSGYTDSTVMRTGFVEEGARFLQKPFSADTLATKVREALDASG